MLSIGMLSIIELPDLIQAIRKVNEDAVIVIIGMYNPFKGVTANMSGDTLDLSVFDEYINYLLDAFGMYGIGMELAAEEVDYVGARDVEIKKTEFSMFEVLGLMGGDVSALYPNEAGHAYIAEQITNALKITFPGDEPVDR